MALIAGSAEIFGVGIIPNTDLMISKMIIKDHIEPYEFIVPAPVFDSHMAPMRISAIKSYKLSMATREAGSDGVDLLREVFQFWG